MYKCSELQIFEDDTPQQHHPDIVASNDEHHPIEGDADYQRRLACLLWAWTDKDVD